jgi:2-polyprenyl-6-methoxyphenol hydroxylase-like FAD-dependent oxidoreductase
MKIISSRPDASPTTHRTPRQLFQRAPSAPPVSTRSGVAPFDRLVGRMVLVGDGAHAPTSMTGRGFGTSLDDAAALARSARDESGNYRSPRQAAMARSM